jgi:uncharacterized membrane protein
MAFCQSCGAPVEGRFCAKCGAPSGQDAGAPAGAPPPIPPVGSGTSGLTDNVAGALCYLLVGIVFLLIEPYNRNKTIRFHAFQSLFLLAASWVVSFVFSSLAVMMGMIFFLPIVHLGIAAIWLFMMFKTYSGDKVVLPVIGPIAEKQA